MSFSDPSGQFDQPMQQFDDPNGYWNQFALDSDQFNSSSQADRPHLLPLKRLRGPDENQPGGNSRRSPPVNRGTSNIFFKTRMCAKFKSGMCRNGENCNFAHGLEDLRQPPPNWQDLVGARDEDHRSSSSAVGNWDDDQKIIHRMKLCKKFYNGEECPYGDRCSFLHEDPSKFRDDSGKFRETSAICIGTTGASTGPANGSGQQDGIRSNGSVDGRGNSKPVYWKTKLCTKWEVTGHCPFGEKCHFAHGQAELQAPGGRNEGDAGPTVSLPGMSQPVPLVDQSVTVPLNGPLLTDERQSKKSLLRWKGHRKIDQIYGDWLEGLPIGEQEPDSSKLNGTLQ
ncbi:hypothetical protein MLD38_006216 [Melastoma candidum]|uniref:Uncharacterized protein n=1 Tax=Melastoma candidum TaxID=119954 RepID=A0ACB9RND7_9MYRT|nr:hypothetical protein MLD38_006216 [Melastoma candidum]